MSMRVTNSMMSQNLLTQLQRSYETMARTNEQISSGYRVNRPSDDPLAAGQARLRQGDLDDITAGKKGVDAATSWLSAAETGLSSINSILARARELTVQGANGSVSQENRDAIAAELDQLIESAKDAMNAKVGDNYIFSGTATATPPYAAGTGDAYQGDGGQVLRSIGAGVTLQVNPSLVPLNATPAGTAMVLNAQAVLGDGGSDGRVLSTLRTIAEHLRGGTPADLNALNHGDLSALEANTMAVANARSAVGTVQNRADAAGSRLDQLETVATKVVSDLTGTDIVKALTDYNAQQYAYQAALRAGASIIQPSLMDFLR
jgi:flagellar hook-associated protein 3 FlgL